VVSSGRHGNYSVPTQGPEEVQDVMTVFVVHKSDGTELMFKP